MDTALDMLRRARDAVDISPVPFLKGALSITLSIVELIQTMRSNDADREALQNHLVEVAHILESLASHQKGRIAIPTSHELQNALIRFKIQMEGVERKLKSIHSQPRLKRLFISVSNKSQLAQIRADIGDSMSMLKGRLYLCLGVNILKTVQSGSEPKGVLKPFGRDDFEFSRDHPAPGFYKIKIRSEPHANEDAVLKICESLDEFVSDREHYLKLLYYPFTSFHTSASLRTIASNPYLLQVFGQSSEQDPTKFLILRSPGVKIQLMIKQFCDQDQGKACVAIVEMMSALIDAASSLLHKASGGCLFEGAEIYIKPDNSPVLADWNPARAYRIDASQKQQTQVVWDEGLVPLLSKSLTGIPYQANFVYKDTSLPLGHSVVKVVRSLVHFIWDYRRNCAVSSEDHNQDDLSASLLKKFSKDLHILHDDVSALQTRHAQAAGVEDINFLQTALVERFGSWLCGIWDVWAPLDVKPGDVGYMVQGRDKFRPKFQKLFNIADEAQDDPIHVTDEIVFIPRTGTWTSDVLGPDLVRHTLQLDSLRPDSKWIAIQRGRKLSSLNRNFQCAHAWKSFLSNAQEYIRRMEVDGTIIDRSDIVMIFSHSTSQGYSFIEFSGEDRGRDPRQTLSSAGFNGDQLYYFETLRVEDGHLQGYWSVDPMSGHPVWPPRPDAQGPSWGWEHVTPDFRLKVEVSRKGPLEHIRYLQF